MEIKDITELVGAFGWESIISRNPYMISFKKGDERMNVYFTTMTVTIQSLDGSHRSYKDILSPDLLEDIVDS